MTTKLVGLFPYLYFHQPLELDNIRFTPFIYYDPNSLPFSEANKRHLIHLLRFFKDERGQPVIAATCFLTNVDEGKIEKVTNQIQQAITILRFSLLSATHKEFPFEQTFFYLFE